MRICYLNRSLKEYTGAGRFGSALIGQLKSTVPNLECAVLTTEPSNHPLVSPLIYGNKIKLLLAIPKIRGIFKKHEIVHALDGWPYGVVAALALIGLKRPKLIITAIGTGAVKPLYDWKRRWLMKWAYRRAGAVAAVSGNTKREIQKFLPDLKIEVINHGVDATKFQIPNLKFQINPKIQNLKPYILSTGFLKERKGFEFSIRAFAEIANRLPRVTYAIFGTDNYPDEREYKRLKQLAEELGVGKRVAFLSYDERWFDSAHHKWFGGKGRISDEELAALYKNAELFVLLPQDFNKDIEGFGLVFLEAAACGLPVIATKETSAEDAVRWQPTPTIQTYPNDPNKKIVEKELSYKLGKIFFEIYDKLGRFCRERQYADALAEKLLERGIKFSRELPLETAGRKSNFVDFLIESKILVELKTKPFIEKQDYYQVLRYLENLNIELGLLVNFRDRYLKPKRILNAKLNKKQFGSFGSNSDGSGRINGILVSPGDYKEAARAMEKILSDEKLKTSFSEESVRFAKEMSWEKAAVSYKKIYEQYPYK